MCGRYVQVLDDGAVRTMLKADWEDGGPLGPRYNIAPNQRIWAVLERYDREGRGMMAVRWGLVPSWSRDEKTGAKMINARVETVTEKPSFRAAASKRRCLIPASGYYEWMTVAGGKRPYYLHPEGDGLLAFAGLYEIWTPKTDPDADPLWTATIITTAAPDALGQIHDRTPVILPESMWADWLDPDTTDRADVESMLAAVPEPALVPRPVGKAVGNVRSQGPQLIEEVEV